MTEGELILYTTEDGKVEVQLRTERGTVWITQAEMAALFQTTPQNITQHVKAIYSEGELLSEATCKERLQVQREGTRAVRRPVKQYSLDMSFNERDVLKHAGKVEAAMAEKLAVERYEGFDAVRREASRLAADAEDVSALEKAGRNLGRRRKK